MINQKRKLGQARDLGGVLFCIPIVLAIDIIGVAAKFLHPEMNSLYALPIFIQDMNPWLAGLVTTSLVASISLSLKR